MNKSSAFPRRPLALRLLRLVWPSARTLRMTAYGCFAFGVLGAAAARSVYADVREMGLSTGHELAKLEDLTGDGYLIHVNGADAHRASANTALGVHEVMDRYESYCKSSPGALGRAMQDIPNALIDRIEMPKSSLRSSVVRSDNEQSGMIACFVDNPDAPSASLAARLTALSRTGDLSELGRFRYAFAERSKGGSTHVVTFWSDSELNLQKMFPAQGDAPGTDSALAPRPAGSRRTMSASVDGYPAAVRIYEAAGNRATVAQSVDASLRERGFATMSTTDKGVVYQRGDRAEVIVSFVSMRDGAYTTVTFVESNAKTVASVRAEDRQ